MRDTFDFWHITYKVKIYTHKKHDIPTGGYGNWRDYLTLPNILRVFNPHLVGYSTGDGTTVDKGAGFNVGEAGALSHQMPYQARVLVERIKRDRKVDFQLDWKVWECGYRTVRNKITPRIFFCLSWCLWWSVTMTFAPRCATGRIPLKLWPLTTGVYAKPSTIWGTTCREPSSTSSPCLVSKYIIFLKVIFYKKMYWICRCAIAHKNRLPVVLLRYARNILLLHIRT